MIKKITTVLLCAAIMTSLVCGCASDSTGNTTDNTTETTSETTAETAISYGTATKLGEYKGLEATQTVQTIKDEDVDGEIEMILGENPEQVEVTDRAAEVGDTVNIDYEGTIDGVKFDGGTGNYDLLLGSGQFIPGFEDQVAGMKPGETKDVKCTFPEDYTATDLAGKDAVFKTTLNKITVSKTPELTDEWVQTYTQGDCSTVDEFKVKVKDELQKYCDESSLTQTKSELIAQIINNSEFEFDEETIQSLYDEQLSYYESYASQYGVDVDTLLQLNGMDKEGLKSYTYSICKQSIIESAIYDKEKMTLTDADYQAVADKNGMTVEDLKSQYGTTADEAAKSYKVDQFIYDNAKITKQDGQVLN